MRAGPKLARRLRAISRQARAMASNWAARVGRTIVGATMRFRYLGGPDGVHWRCRVDHRLSIWSAPAVRRGWISVGICIHWRATAGPAGASGYQFGNFGGYSMRIQHAYLACGYIRPNRYPLVPPDRTTPTGPSFLARLANGGIDYGLRRTHSHSPHPSLFSSTA